MGRGLMNVLARTVSAKESKLRRGEKVSMNCRPRFGRTVSPLCYRERYGGKRLRHWWGRLTAAVLPGPTHAWCIKATVILPRISSRNFLYSKIAQKADAIVAGKESESMAQTVVFECESP